MDIDDALSNILVGLLFILSMLIMVAVATLVIMLGAELIKAIIYTVIIICIAYGIGLFIRYI